MRQSTFRTASRFCHQPRVEGADLFSTYSFIGYTAAVCQRLHPSRIGWRGVATLDEPCAPCIPAISSSPFLNRRLSWPCDDVPKDDWSHWTCEVSEEDANWARKQVDHRTPTQELGVGLNNAVLDFLLTWALRSRRNGSLEFHHTMMIHTKETKKSMKPWITRVNNRLASMQSAIFEGRVWAMEHGQNYLMNWKSGMTQNSFKMGRSGALPSIDDVFAQLKLLMSHRRGNTYSGPMWPTFHPKKPTKKQEKRGVKTSTTTCIPKAR